MNKNNSTVAGSIFSVLIVIGLAWYYFGGGFDHGVNVKMQQISDGVAADSVKQYEIARRNGNLMDAYTQAAITAEAFLQAKDEANYKKWVAIRNDLAAKLGMPDQ